MVSEKSDGKKIEKGFTIENNILTGMTKECELETHNIGQIILNIFNNDLSHVAQIEAETGKQTTFEDMKENTIRCALWLQKQGIGKGDVVAICTHNQLDAYIPSIATFFVSAIYNPWHHEVPLKTARHLMSLTRPKVIFSCESAVKVLKEAAELEKVDARIIVFGKYAQMESLKDIMRLQTNEEVGIFKPQQIKDPNTVAMILFSSGTTGLPKGVAHSYATIFKNIVTFSLTSPKKSVTFWYSSLYWISGTHCMIQTILNCGTRILHAAFDPEETCKVIDKYKVTWSFLAPTTVTQWSKSEVLKKYKITSLKVLLTGGAKLSKEILNDMRTSLPHTSLFQGYGMTELGGICSLQNPQCKKIESVGFVMPNMRIKIIDLNNGQVLGPNQAGEVCCKSPTSMLCYYKNVAATKATIDEEGWVHTGDKGYYDENGEILIVDRLKEVMKCRGYQISPFEIEEVLLGHPGVAEVAVVPIPHEIDGDWPMAFVKKNTGSTVTEEELIELSAVLGEIKKLWGGVKFLDEMLYTSSGKINRKDLKELAKTYTQ